MIFVTQAVVNSDMFYFEVELCCESFPGSWDLVVGPVRREVCCCELLWVEAVISSFCGMTAVVGLNHLI